MPHTRQQTLPLAVAVVLVFVEHPTRSAAYLPPPREPSIHQLIEQLVHEAEQAKRDLQLAHPSADAASRWEHQLAPREITEALRKPAHRDPFIDAYVRWQLTSFAAPLGDFDDRQFLRFLQDAPALLPNPMADPKIIADYQAAAESGPLPPTTLERIKAVTGELLQRQAAAKSLNEPALEFREWVLDQCPATGPRRIQWLLETCAASVQAGWPPAEIKARVTRQIEAVAGEADFLPDQRRVVARQARKLAGLHRPFVSEVSFPDDGEVRAPVSLAEVQPIDVEQWLAALAAETP